MKNDLFLKGEFQLLRYFGEEKVYNGDDTESSTPNSDYTPKDCYVCTLSAEMKDVNKDFTDSEIDFLSGGNGHFRFDHRQFFDLSKFEDLARFKLILRMVRSGQGHIAESEAQIKADYALRKESSYTHYIMRIA